LLLSFLFFFFADFFFPPPLLFSKEEMLISSCTPLRRIPTGFSKLCFRTPFAFNQQRGYLRLGRDRVSTNVENFAIIESTLREGEQFANAFFSTEKKTRDRPSTR